MADLKSQDRPEKVRTITVRSTDEVELVTVHSVTLSTFRHGCDNPLRCRLSAPFSIGEAN
jgi:hypothetical protein